ncbi:class I SAM-dependent methyltransferase [Streptomyces chartreusis]|uniref:class I SAM-dependent methyltransferase n=1 Tax=Streptomyces chartreusis TaxID=1969 RepID=UPI0033B28FC0
MATVPDDIRQPYRLDDVPGWFHPLDQVLFEWLLTRQETDGHGGDLLEIGAYLGKSAIFLGGHVRTGEMLTVCDLFESQAPDDENSAELAIYSKHSTFTRKEFERNYLDFHDSLPRIIQAPSSTLSGKLKFDSCRFVHIDGSHLYHHVYEDIATAHDVLLPGGIVAIDDIREEHTPGVSIAAWEAVLQRDLRPVCLSSKKLYATWDDPQTIQDDLLDMLKKRGDCKIWVQQAAGHRVVSIRSRGTMTPPCLLSKQPRTEPHRRFDPHGGAG